MIPLAYAGTEFRVIYLDTETTGLDPYSDQLVAVGVAVNDRPPRALLHDRDRDLIERVLDADAMFVGHNLGFDWHFLEASGYRIPDSSRWLDTQLLAHVNGVDGERLAGNTALAKLTKRLIEAGELPEDILEPEREIKRWRLATRRAARKAGQPPPELGDAPPGLLLPYLRADVEQTRAVARHYSGATGQDRVLELERRCLPAIYAAERRGVPIDAQAAISVRSASAAKLGDLRARLFELAGRPFSLDSAQQLEPILHARGVDLEDAARTPTGLLARSAAALERIDDDLVRTLLEHRTERVFHGLLDGLVKRVRDGRLHGSFRQVGAATGRMSSGNPNLQNVPASDLRARYLVCASPGNVLVACDLDNVELRVAASYMPGGRLARALAGGDLHQQTADALGIERGLAKNVNFGILYGAGAPRVSQVLGVSLEAAKVIRDDWYRLYPEVRRLNGQLGQAIRRRGYIRTAGGRRHYAEQADHRMLNYLIQGSAADVLKTAVAELHEHGVAMILFIHDEVVAEVPEEEADATASLLEDVLTRDLGVVTGLVATATAAQRWSDFKQPDYRPGKEVST